MKNIGERIKTLRLNRGLPQKELAKLVNVSSTAISQWERGETEPRAKYLPKLCQALNTTIDWLTLAIREPFIVPEGMNSCLNVPFYPDITAAGGGGSFNEDETTTSTPIPINIIKNRDIRSICCLTVTGESMEPILSDGSLIAIDRSETKIKDGKIYVFKQNGLLRVKQLKLTPFEVIVSSFNPAYKDEVYPVEGSDELSLIGRVFWFSSII
ncbi:XRE family transcriptional regulator [Vibrio lentus]|uniref:XRE family transcriptional regulator n=1 Tax=Vibrio cyclitrophicus TaxID=47951 RepID=UPI000C830585|nr:S24 family peptidase [Vibrio cyclitrophicus]PMI46102.1 hypothetical protein BCU44_09890 [Vibrio cyclitrophicus]CAK3443785.1 HTH-type transcriptional regulator, cell division transcriptional repressor [Vibrio crassostreae]CAK3884718.1 HTH-type transcriptional regulator, cell division transcriptional repressor [Vibrio crassostreae]